jgi:hypothetical protein
MQEIYSPREYYQRVRRFLLDYRPQKLRWRPMIGMRDIAALLKSIFML